MKKPVISVVMPARNMETFIPSSVDSILRQTFDNFEFIIIDDASTDKTKSLLEAIEDPRIVRLYSKTQQGNYKCRNWGLENCKGQYVCVMDADDVAHPDRLLKQYTFMEANPQYQAAGSDIEFFSEGLSPRLFTRQRDENLIKVQLLKDNVCTHPSLIIRKNVFEQYNIRYNEDLYYSGDYDLMVSIAQIGNITNIPEPLLRYRIHPHQISSAKRMEQSMYADQIRLKQLSFFNIRPSIDEIIIHLCLMKDFPIPASKSLLAEKWCNKLLAKNNKLNLYDQQYLFNFLAENLYKSLRHLR